ncbi:MAG TPA: DUF4266 domain-containing protein [Sandaracinaceae bacterium]
MGSRSSSERPSSERRGEWPLFALLAIALGAAAGGCVMVRPEQREFLADPAMTFGADGTAGSQEEHVLSNREGAYGGGTTTGGGCGCN